MICDVLVVGAGPAGAGLAIMLAERGVSVLLLDKEHFPRHKACGGGVDGLALRELTSLGVDVSLVQEDAPVELRITSGGRHPTLYRFAQPLARMTTRANLDALIAETAMRRGALFHDGVAARKVHDDGRLVAVETAQGRYHGRVLVGADGVFSTVARGFNLNDNPIRYVLTSADLAADQDTLAEWQARAQIDISVWPLGYSWVFPKRGHLSVGTGVPLRCAKDLKRCFTTFLRRSKLADFPVRERRSHMIGFRRGRAALALDRVLLIGDAAGLVDPNTGAGIGLALVSARLAADAIVSFLQRGTGTLCDYTRTVDHALGAELAEARILRNTILFRLLVTGGRATAHRSIWNQVTAVIRGEQQYKDWYAHSRMSRWLSWTGGIPL